MGRRLFFAGGFGGWWDGPLSPTGAPASFPRRLPAPLRDCDEDREGGPGSLCRPCPLVA